MLIYDSEFGNITIAFNEDFGHFQHDWWIVTGMTNFPFSIYRSTSLPCCMLAKTNLSNFVHKASIYLLNIYCNSSLFVAITFHYI